MLFRLAVYCSLLLPHNEAAYCLCHPKHLFENWSQNTCLCKNLGRVAAEDNISDACAFYSNGALKEMDAVGLLNNWNCDFDYPARLAMLEDFNCIMFENMLPNSAIPQICVVSQCDDRCESSTAYENAPLRSYWHEQKKMTNARIETFETALIATAVGSGLAYAAYENAKKRYAANRNNLQAPLLATHPERLAFVEDPVALEDAYVERIALFFRTYVDHQAHRAPPVERIALRSGAAIHPLVRLLMAEEERTDRVSSSHSNLSSQEEFQEDHLLHLEYESFSRQATPTIEKE